MNRKGKLEIKTNSYNIFQNFLLKKIDSYNIIHVDEIEK